MSASDRSSDLFSFHEHSLTGRLSNPLPARGRGFLWSEKKLPVVLWCLHWLPINDGWRLAQAAGD